MTVSAGDAAEARARLTSDAARADKYVTHGHIVTKGTGPQVLINDNLGVMKSHQIGQNAIFSKPQLRHTKTKASPAQLAAYRKGLWGAAGCRGDPPARRARHSESPAPPPTEHTVSCCWRTSIDVDATPLI